MTTLDEADYPDCPACGGDLTYDVRMEALDDENIENGYRLTIKVVCQDCPELTPPTPRMQEDMMAIAAALTPEGAVVTPADDGDAQNNPQEAIRHENP